jgi:hypothetical protein
MTHERALEGGDGLEVAVRRAWVDGMEGEPGCRGRGGNHGMGGGSTKLGGEGDPDQRHHDIL